MMKLLRCLTPIIVLISAVISMDELKGGFWLPSEEDKNQINAPCMEFCGLNSDNTGLKNQLNVKFLKLLVETPTISIKYNQGCRGLAKLRTKCKQTIKSKKKWFEDDFISKAREYAFSEVKNVQKVLERFSDAETQDVKPERYEELIKGFEKYINDSTKIQKANDILRASMAFYLDAGRDYILGMVQKDKHIIELNVGDKKTILFSLFLREELKAKGKKLKDLGRLEFASVEMKDFIVDVKSLSKLGASLLQSQPYIVLSKLHENMIALKLCEPDKATKKKKTQKSKKLKSRKTVQLPQAIVEFDMEGTDIDRLTKTFGASLYLEDGFRVDYDNLEVIVDLAKLSSKNAKNFRAAGFELSKSQDTTLKLRELYDPELTREKAILTGRSAYHEAEFVIGTEEASNIVDIFDTGVYTAAAFTLTSKTIRLDVRNATPEFAGKFVEKFGPKSGSKMQKLTDGQHGALIWRSMQ